jgi:microcystin-dependent protein
MGWTTPATWASGDWNLQIRDNLQYLYQDLIPAGTIMAYCSSSPPTGFLLCNATAVTNVAPYTNLYAVLPGSGTKYTPDLRDRFIVGAGSSYANTNTGGAASQTHSHTEGNLTARYLMGSNGVNYYQDRGTSGWYTTAVSGNNYSGSVQGPLGSGAAVAGSTGDVTLDNRPPYYALTYIIKY